MGLILTLVGLLCLFSTTTTAETDPDDVEEVELPEVALDCIKGSVPMIKKYELCMGEDEETPEETCENQVKADYPNYDEIRLNCEVAGLLMNEREHKYANYILLRDVGLYD